MRKGHASRLRKGRYSESGRIYTVTAVTWQRKPLLHELFSGRCVVRALMEASDQAETLCYVVMPDHLHWLMALRSHGNLSRAVQKMKSRATFNLRQRGFAGRERVWEEGFYDRALRQEDELVAAARYIVANPLRAGLVSSVGNYALWDAVWLE